MGGQAVALYNSWSVSRLQPGKRDAAGRPPWRVDVAARRGADAGLYARRHGGDGEGGAAGCAGRAGRRDHPGQHVSPCLLYTSVLRYQEEMSPPEIAELLGQPIATVKSNLQRGLQLLRRKACLLYTSRCV